MNLNTKSLIVVAAATILSACGGGGSGGGTDSGGTLASGLSTTQKNFEAAAKNDDYVTFSWYLPSTNVTPTPGTNYFYYAENSTATSPASGPALDADTVVNLTATLSVPPLTQQSVGRVLKAGAIYPVNAASKQVWSYAGDDVVLTTYAADGTTPLVAIEYDDWSAPIPLSGTIASATVLNSFLGFTRLIEPNNFDFTQGWLPGSSYFTRKGFGQDTALYLFDWGAATYGADVTPYPGPETTIEGMFANPAYANGIISDKVTYTIASGSISTIEGARVWVATNPRPTSASPTVDYLVYVELNGKIYFGSLRKAGARLNVIDGVDTTIVHDYTIRLNGKAAQSIAQAVKF